MRATVNGVGLECRIDGPARAPWIVFSHSLMTNLTLWDAQAAALQAEFRVLRYDQRGHGASDLPAPSSTIDDLANDVLGLMDRFDIESAFLVGSSMGGVSAMAIASRQPHRTHGIVVAGAQWASPETAVTTWDERIAAAAHGMAPLVEPTIARWFTPEFVAANSPDLNRVRAMIRATRPEGFTACARALQHYDVRNEVAAIRVPALFIVGDADGVLPPVMRRMHEAVAGSQFLEIPRAGHLPNIERPEAFTGELTTFLHGTAPSTT